MKKFVALILAVVMVFALATSASAVTTNKIESVTENNTVSGTVYVTVKNYATPVYHVDVTWDDLTFTYTFGQWNSTSHTYSTGGWDKTSATVTVANHSDMPVKYTATATKKTVDLNAALQNVTLTLGDYTDPVNLPSAVGTAYDNPPKDTFTINVSEAPTQIVSTVNAAELGTVTVTITAGT